MWAIFHFLKGSPSEDRTDFLAGPWGEGPKWESLAPPKDPGIQIPGKEWYKCHIILGRFLTFKSLIFRLMKTV
jgi:hypothetical protein